MTGLENMSTRLNYAGGAPQIKRMNEDKLKSLKKALLYSYQSATAILSDGREFRCLINPDQLKNEYDNKIISIPFEDICLNQPRVGKTTEGIQPIGLKPGDVITWKETSTDWLVYLQYFEETAYFRAELRRCKYTVDVDGVEYKCYAARPSVNEIDWRVQQKNIWNDIDYNLKMYITKDEKTEAFFHRFTVVKINGKPWEVQAIDNMSSDGIIIMALKEHYQNTIQDKEDEKKKEAAETAEKQSSRIPKKQPIILGPNIVYPYDECSYSVENISGGDWVLETTKAKIIDATDTTVDIEITTGRSGNFELIYTNHDIVIKYPITIESL